MNLLIVGGNGFIGRHIAERALQKGWCVTSIGLSGLGLLGTRCFAADITDLEMLRAAIKKMRFEYVVNCGGYIDHRLFFNDGRDVVETHFNGVLNLVQTIDRSALRCFINIGSSDEYGAVEAPQSEASREAPISPYSLGKLAATHFLQMLHKTEQYPAIILRPFLTYGPGQNRQRFIPQIILGCLEDRTFPTSAGAQVRDFCYIEDTVNAVFAAMKEKKAIGEIINIGSGQGRTIRNIIEKVREMVGAGNPQFGTIPYREGENMSLYANIEKAKKILNWSPQIDLDKGLEQTIVSYRKMS